MPTPSLTEIFLLLEEKPTEKKHHFLFLLGTDTKFTPSPTLPYMRGETLSYSAQSVVSLLGEEGKIHQTSSLSALSYSSPSVEVVDGPTTLGTEVGERIAEGVLLALRAAASGKQTLQIASHSRGAVEAIMVVSELARIKKALKDTPNLSLHEILCTVPSTGSNKKEDNSHITEAMKKLIPPGNETQEKRKELLKNLEKLEVNPFLIDPVPGGSRLGLKAIRWHSDRFYEELVCKSHELILLENERTCCFTPIRPKGTKVCVLPGHHGTASGNGSTQQGNKVPDYIKNQDTLTVQTLVICKLFSFFNQSTELFKTELFKQDQKPVNLKHPELDAILNEFLRADKAGRQKLLLTHYNNILKNREAYKFFETTSYPYLGRQYAGANKEYRFVHNQGNRHDHMGSIKPPIDETFVNEEHAILSLQDIIGLDDDLSGVPLDTIISTITGLLEKTISMMMNGGQSEENPSDLTLLKLFQNEKGREIFFKSISVLIDSVSQKYLQNNLSKEDKSLQEVIGKPFAILRVAKQNIAEQHRATIISFQELIQSQFVSTIEAQYKSILHQIDFLNDQINQLVSPNPFPTLCKSFMDNIKQGENFPEEFSNIPNILAKTPPESIKDLDELDKALENAISSIKSENQEEIRTIITSKRAEYFKLILTSTPDYLTKLEHLYNLAETLNRDYVKLEELLDNKKITIQPKQLQLRMLSAIEAGGLLLKTRNVDLRKGLNCVSSKFFNFIKLAAIRNGALSPEAEDVARLSQEKSEKDQLLSAKIQEINSLKEECSIVERVVKDTKQALENANENLVKTKEELQNKNEKLLETKEELQNKEDKIKDHKEITRKLNTKEEKDKAILISDKLLPATNDYLKSLFNQAKNLADKKNIKLNEILSELPENNFSNPDLKKAYDKIVLKYNVVLRLKQQLEYSEETPLPSARVEKFRQALQQSDTLKTHRSDEAGMLWITTCLIALGIILTGILPGAFAWGIYKYTTGRNLLFYSHYTQGEKYIDDCTHELKKAHAIAPAV